MTPLVHGVLIAYVVAGVALFRFLPARRAVIILAVLGVLFLPEVQSKPVNPEAPAALSVPCYRLTKLNAVATTLLIGSLLFDRRRWTGLRPQWFDLPVVVWCLSPAVAMIGNAVFYDDPVSPFDPALLPAEVGWFGHALNWLEFAGVYDAFSQTVDQVLIWGVPYWMGRLYFADRDGLRALALGVTAGGLLYVPPCLLEVRLIHTPADAVPFLQ
jgi:hypothetical protein